MTTPTPVTGRGAFPASGVGGTRKPGATANTTAPGPYYMHATEQMIGLAAFRAIRDGQAPDVNELAVHYGVRAIQTDLNRQYGTKLAEDGIFGASTAVTLTDWQRAQGLRADGVAGPATCKLLFGRAVAVVYDLHTVPTRIGRGLVALESGWDPGAVGRSDAEDLGLCQINGRAHPDLSAEFRLTPSQALTWQADFVSYLLNGMGNERDGIAAYNLGLGGARTWVKAGRPDPYTPPGSTAPRSVVAYVDTVLRLGAR